MTTPNPTYRPASFPQVETIEMLAASAVGRLPAIVRDGPVLGWACDEVRRQIHAFPTLRRSALVSAVADFLILKLIHHLTAIVVQLLRGAPARIKREQEDVVAGAFAELLAFTPPADPPQRMSVWLVLEFFARRQLNALQQWQQPKRLRANLAAPLRGADFDFSDWVDSLRLDPLDRAVLLDLVDASSPRETAEAQHVTLRRVNRRRWRLRNRLRDRLGAGQAAATLVG
jgi:hypothetical protein